MINYLFSAISFLTIIPVPKKYRQGIKHILPFFPVVGLFIGGILVLIKFGCSFVFYKIVVDLLIITVTIIINGGLHLDGLADSLDGLYAGKNKDEILEVMNDSHIGTMGVIGIALVILSKFVLLNNIDTALFNSSLILFPVLGRWAMVLSMGISKPAKETGLGNYFLSNISKKDFVISGIITFLITTFVFQFKGIIIFLFISVFSYIFTKYVKKKINGITGDTLGAINEISEVLVLILLNIK